MRLDRLVTLGLVNPVYRIVANFAPSTFNSAHYSTLPILMYHSISDDQESQLSPYYKNCTSPRLFANHMAWLDAAGYRGVTLSEGLATLQVKSDKGEEPRAKTLTPSLLPLPPSSIAPSPRYSSVSSGTTANHVHSPSAKLVAITFDDGFSDFYTYAFPSLQRHGFSATMYLPTAFIGDQRKKFLSRDCLSWSEVGELAQAGIEFGSHSVTHPKLIELAWPNIERELSDSKNTIEQRLGRNVLSFAYPYAYPQANRAFARRFCSLLADTGYRSGVTTTIGQAQAGDYALQLSRLPVNSADDRSLFEAKLRGAYDWMFLPQHSFKMVKHPFRKPTPVG